MAANFAGLLVAIGPPTLTKYSLINSGNHFENLFFTSVAPGDVMVEIGVAYADGITPGHEIYLDNVVLIAN